MKLKCSMCGGLGRLGNENIVCMGCDGVGYFEFYSGE